MTNREEIDQLAGEYVLGTLNAEERLAVETRRLQDAALEAAIHDWTQRLAPLQEEISSAVPDPHLFDRIQVRLDQLEGQGGTGGGGDRNGGTVLSLQKHVSRWRNATLVTGAIAASLLAYILVNAPLVQGPQQETFVAVFQSDDQQPAFRLSIDLKTRALTIQPVAAERQQQASYQLWIVGDGIAEEPQSLGLLSEDGALTQKSLADYPSEVLQQATFGISVEPPGGSPTGKPTGPAIHGYLIPVQP